MESAFVSTGVHTLVCTLCPTISPWRAKIGALVLSLETNQSATAVVDQEALASN